MATKSPRARKKDAEVVDNSLLLALQFIAIAQRSTGTIGQTHCILRDGWAVASDGVLTAGHRIADSLTACPQTERLILALQRCKQAFSVTEHDADRLSVKAGGFRVSVPCVQLDAVPVTWADAPVAPIDARFIDACRYIAHLATEGAQRVALAAVLMRGQTVVATNNYVVAEAFHGIDLPPCMLIPKTTIAALMKIDKKLTRFGCSAGSVSFHYEDESWIKSQCYGVEYPNMDKAMARQAAGPLIETPAGFFEAVTQLEPFANADKIRFEDNKLCAVTIDRDGAEQDVEGVIGGPIFSVKQLKNIAGIATHLDTTTSDRCAYFIAKNQEGTTFLRGAISKMVE